MCRLFSTRSSLRVLTRRVSGSPSPLKIEAAQLAGDADCFADEIKTGNPLRLHGLGGQVRRIDSAGRHFRFLIAFGSGGHELPSMIGIRERFDLTIAQSSDWHGRYMYRRPSICQPLGKVAGRHSTRLGTVARGAPAAQLGGEIDTGEQVDFHGV